MLKVKQILCRRQNNGILIKSVPALLIFKAHNTFSVCYFIIIYAFRNKAIILLLFHYLITLLFSLPQSLDGFMIILSLDGVIIYVGGSITCLLGHLPVSFSSFGEGSFWFIVQGFIVCFQEHITHQRRCSLNVVKMCTCFIVMFIGFSFKSIKTNCDMR